jgi:hypothetical protein
MLDCYWKQSLGMDCPGCGMQRATLDLMHGDLAGSWHHFPALFPLIFLILYAGMHLIKPKMFPAKIIVVSVSITAFFMLGNWLLKMI